MLELYIPSQLTTSNRPFQSSASASSARTSEGQGKECIPKASLYRQPKPLRDSQKRKAISNILPWLINSQSVWTWSWNSEVLCRFIHNQPCVLRLLCIALKSRINTSNQVKQAKKRPQPAPVPWEIKMKPGLGWIWPQQVQLGTFLKQTTHSAPRKFCRLETVHDVAWTSKLVFTREEGARRLAKIQCWDIVLEWPPYDGALCSEVVVAKGGYEG